MLTIDEFVARLDAVSPLSGSKWRYKARCPIHEDHNPSLSIGLDPDTGEIITKCHGCGAKRKEIARAVGLSEADLVPERVPLTAAEYSRDKKLPMDFLVDLGLRDSDAGVEIPYGDSSRSQVRTHSSFFWKKGDKRPIRAYGWDSPNRSMKGSTILVEGASDAQTLWLHNMPALGIPGANMGGKLKISDLVGVDRIWIVQEPDQGGSEFLAGVQKRALQLGWKGDLRVVSFNGQAKDPSDLYIKLGADFKLAFRKMLSDAPLLDLEDLESLERSETADDVEGLEDLESLEPLERVETTGPTKGAIRPQALPLELFVDLPENVNSVARLLHTDQDRDLFVVSVLPVLAGGMPNVHLTYSGRSQGLNLYTGIVAPAGEGKGAMQIAEDVGRGLDKFLEEVSEAAYEQWELEATGDGPPKPKPPDRRLFFGGDASASGMIEHIHANPNGVLFESEIKTITQALRQDWGSWRDILLKCSHGETIRQKRKDQRQLTVHTPSLSVVVSGTYRSFCEIIGDVEDGLFSRFMWYILEGQDAWIDQFETDTDVELSRAVDALGKDLMAIYRALSMRQDPLIMSIDDRSRRLINQSGMLGLGVLRDSSDSRALRANVKRAALGAFRIGAILTLIAHPKRDSLQIVQSVSVRPEFVKLGLLISFACLENARQLAALLPKSKGTLTIKQRFLDSLPEGEFTSAEAYACRDKIEWTVSDKTVRNHLNDWCRDGGPLEHKDYMTFRKPEAKSAEGASILSVLEQLGLTNKETGEDDSIGSESQKADLTRAGADPINSGKLSANGNGVSTSSKASNHSNLSNCSNQTGESGFRIDTGGM